MENDTIGSTSRFGGVVYWDREMDELRRTRCLCNNCKIAGHCPAREVMDIGDEMGVAYMVTRCGMWQRAWRGETVTELPVRPEEASR